MSGGRVFYPPGGGTGGGSFSGGVSTLGNTLGTTGTVSNGIVFAGGANITLSQSSAAGGATITVIGGAGAAGNTGYVSAGTNTASLGTLSFSDASGVSFGITGQTLTASVATNYLTSQSNQAYSAGNGSATFQTLTLADSNGVSFSSGTQGLYATVKTDYLTSQSNQAFSASGGSSTFQTLSFQNANGATFSNVAGQVRISYTVPPAYSFAPWFSGNTTGDTTATTVQSDRVSFYGDGLVSVGFGSDSILISGGGNRIVIKGDTADNASTVEFADSHNISWGMNANTITASASYPAQSNQTNRVYFVGNTTGQSSSSTYDARTLSIDGAGIVSAGWSAGSLRISATQSNQVFSASGGSSAFQTLNFVNGNGATFTNNAGSVGISYTVPTQSVQTIGVYGSSQTTGQSSSSTYDARSLTFRGAGIVSVGNSGGEVLISAVAAGAGDGGNVLAAGTQTAVSNGSVKFADSNGISFGMSNSSQITASYTVPSTAGLISAINVSAGTTSNNLSALTLSNSNGLSFGLNGSVITGSYTVPTQTNQTLGLYAVSNTTQSSSGTVDARTLSFAGAGIASVGVTNGSVVVSVPSGGGAGFSAGVSTGGNTAGNTGTTSNALVLAGVSGITLSQTTGAGGATVSVVGPAATLSYFRPRPEGNWVSNVFNNVGQPVIVPFTLPQHLAMDRVVHFVSVSISSSSNSSAAGVMSFDVGIYSKNASSLSRIITSSTAYQWTNTSNNSTSAISGVRALTIPLQTTLTPGDYWFAIQSRTSSTNANWFSMRNICFSGANTAISGHFGSASNNTFQSMLGYGLGPFSNTLPASFAFTDITMGTNILFRSEPVFNFVNGTI